MVNYSEQYDQLFLLSQEKGYITYDDVLSYGNNLSPADIDRLLESLQLHGVLLRESEPEKKDGVDDLTDFSRTDYDSIYKQIIDLSPSLQDLILEIKKIPPIQKGNVPVLTAQLENGNMFAREQLIKLHMRLVLKIALSMTKQFDLNIEDAIFSGFIGLIEGIDSFDRNGFNHLMQNISFRVLQKIQRDCVPDWFTIQIAFKKKEIIRYVYAEYKNHFCEKCQTSAICPELEHIILQKYNLSVDELHQYYSLMILLSENKQILNKIIDAYELEYDIFYFPTITKKNIIQEIIYLNAKKSTIEYLFNMIPYREAKLLRYRYGFLTDEPYTLDECGKLLGITRERARQIERSAINHIKQAENYSVLRELFIE